MTSVHLADNLGGCAVLERRFHAADVQRGASAAVGAVVLLGSQVEVAKCRPESLVPQSEVEVEEKVLSQ